MPVALVETKFFRAADPRAGLVPRPRLDDVLGTGRTRLTLVSAPAGFGKTTLLAAWLAERRRADPAHRLGVARRGRQRRGRVLDLRADRARAGRTRHRRGRPGRCSGPASRSRRSWPPCSTSSASCPTTWTSCSTTTTSPRARRSSRAWRSSSSASRRRCTWSSAPAPTRRCPWPGCGPAASSPRSARPTSGSPTRRRRPTSPTPPGSRSTRATSPRSRPAPRAGSRPCSSPRSRCGTATTRPAFIAGFAGDDRYVVDYLVEEVLDRQPDEVRDFLLGTAILDRLTGPLCDAVTETSGGTPDARVAGAPEPVRRPARRPAPLVPLPPPVRRRPPGAPARRARPSGSPGCTGAPATGTTRPGSPSPRSGTRSPPATSSARPSWPSWRSRSCAGYAGRRCSARWVDDLPDDVLREPPGPGHRPGRRPDVQQRVRRRRASGCRTSSGSSRCPTTSWSWSIATSSRGSRRRSRCTAPRWPSTRRRPGRRPSPTPSGPSPWRAEDDDLARGGRLGARRASRPGPPATSRPPTAATPPPPRGSRRAGRIADVLRLLDHARRPRADPRAGSVTPQRTFEHALELRRAPRTRPARHGGHATWG